MPSNGDASDIHADTVRCQENNAAARCPRRVEMLDALEPDRSAKASLPGPREESHVDIGLPGQTKVAPQQTVPISRCSIGKTQFQIGSRDAAPLGVGGIEQETNDGTDLA